jgi:hypothetical protein
MDSFLSWLHDLPISLWVAQSDSVWSFPFILFLHTTGIAVTAGCSFVVAASVLGWMGPFSPSSLRKLFPWFWAGFVLNAASGSLLFMAAATVTGYKPTYYLKLVLILFGVATFVPLGSFLNNEMTAETDISWRVRTLAAGSLVCWAGVIATGRLVAYL